MSAINYKNLTPAVYQSGYSSQQKTKPRTSSVAYPVMGTTKPASKFDLTPAKSQTASASLTPAYKANAVGVTPKVTTAPKTNTALMSGYGAQYGNNPSNQPAVAPKPTNTNTMNSWMGGVNALNGRTAQFYNDSEAKQRELQLQRYRDTVGLQNEMFDNANNDLRAEIPRLDERFGKFESGVRANMAEADQIGTEQKANAQTYTGSAQRTAMENRRQTDAQREKQYAALGTIDSYGTGSFTQGNENADSEFNRNTQQRYDALSQNLTEIDRTVAGAKREALSLIDQERMKYEDTVRAINTQLRDNDVARRGAITEAYYATQEAINGISEQYEGLRIAQEQQKLTFEQEMEKLALENTMPNVSDWFKQTGQPQTQEDFNFIIKNPAGATALQKMIGGGSAAKPTEKQAAFRNAAQSAEHALNLLSSGQVESGFGQGIIGGLGERTGGNSATQQDYRSTIAAARTLARNAMLGANMSEKELESLSALIPEYSDDPEIAKQKLSTFIREMSRYANTQVSGGQSALTPEVLQSLSQFES